MDAHSDQLPQNLLHTKSSLSALINKAKDHYRNECILEKFFATCFITGTWISRLLQSAKVKQLYLSDPGFTYSAVVAATLHTYWSRATDEAVRSSAKKHPETCQSFVEEWSPRWPVSECLVSKLTGLCFIRRLRGYRCRC